jgi:ribose/xylose/arabinose/galactoside ABC-type transport system permease subunit
MGSREAVAGAVFGAFAMVAVSVVFAWLTSGPDHEDWSHAAIAMSPFAALFGGAAGATCGLLVRVTRPRSSRQTEPQSRNRKRR